MERGVIKKHQVLHAGNIQLYHSGVMEGRMETLLEFCMDGVIDLETAAEKVNMDPEAYDTLMRLKNRKWRNLREKEEKAHPPAEADGGETASAELTPEELAALLTPDLQKNAEAFFDGGE